MKKMILLHAAIEMIAGVLFVFRPDLILMTSGQEASTLFLAKMYGIIMFTFGGVCFFLYHLFEYNTVFKKVVMLVMAFHLMIALQTYTGFTQGLLPNLGPFGLHMIMAVLFGGVYMKEINLFK